MQTRGWLGWLGWPAGYGLANDGPEICREIFPENFREIFREGLP